MINCESCESHRISPLVKEFMDHSAPDQEIGGTGEALSAVEREETCVL